MTPCSTCAACAVAFGGKDVVQGIDFSDRAGEKLALVGESGSGKTVTALSLLRLAMPRPLQRQAMFSATARAAGPTCWPSPSARCAAIRGQDIAMIFQEPMTALNPLFTVGDQIAEVLQLKQGLAAPNAAAIESAGKHRHPRARAAGHGLPAPALGWPAPARHDCHGAGLQARACCWPMSPPRRWT